MLTDWQLGTLELVVHWISTSEPVGHRPTQVRCIRDGVTVSGWLMLGKYTKGYYSFLPMEQGMLSESVGKLDL